MKLHSIKLRGFRGYKERTTIEFDNLTALIGKNDAGKTTILEALDIFFNDKKGVVKFDKSDVNVDLFKDNPKFEVEIGCEFTDYPQELVLDESTKTDLESEYLLNSKKHLEIIKKFLPSGISRTYIRALHPCGEHCSNLITTKIKDLRKIVEQHKIVCPDKTSNPVLRKSIWSHFDDLGELNLQETEIEIDKEDGKAIWGKLQNYLPIYTLFQADRKNSDNDDEVQDPLKTAVREILAAPEMQKQLEAIAAKVSKTLRDVSDRTLEKLRELDPNVASTLNPNIPDSSCLKWPDVFKCVSISGDNDIPINKRGSGIKRLILLSFFRAEAERRAQNSSCHIIYGFEEPETSQHPDNQVKLIEAFKQLTKNSNSNAQIIISTHSPKIVKNLKIENLRLIRSVKGKGVEVPKIESNTLPYPSLNEVNYTAFDDISEGYYNELYGFISSVNFDEKYEEATKTKVAYFNQKFYETEHISKEKKIRHQIHHPENDQNTPYNQRELKDSIEKIRQFIFDNKNEMVEIYKLHHR